MIIFEMHLNVLVRHTSDSLAVGLGVGWHALFLFLSSSFILRINNVHRSSKQALYNCFPIPLSVRKDTISK